MEGAFWNSSSDTFEEFLAKLQITVPISLTLTREVLQKKHNIIHAILPDLTRDVKFTIHEIEKLEKQRKAMEDMINNPENSHAKEIDVTAPMKVDNEDSKFSATWCESCSHMCHHPCDISQNRVLTDVWMCSAMT